MNFELLKELKKDIDNYHFGNPEESEYDNFVKELIPKHPNIDELIVRRLSEINKYQIDGNKLYKDMELLRDEIKEFYKKNKTNEEIYKMNIYWFITYINLYMKSDKLFQGLVIRKLDLQILNKTIENMKQIDIGNITKEDSDKTMGKILFKKYGEDLVKKLDKNKK